MTLCVECGKEPPLTEQEMAVFESMHYACFSRVFENEPDGLDFYMCNGGTHCATTEPPHKPCQGAARIHRNCGGEVWCLKDSPGVYFDGCSNCDEYAKIKPYPERVENPE